MKDYFSQQTVLQRLLLLIKKKRFYWALKPVSVNAVTAHGQPLQVWLAMKMRDSVSRPDLHLRRRQRVESTSEAPLPLKQRNIHHKTSPPPRPAHYVLPRFIDTGNFRLFSSFSVCFNFTVWNLAKKLSLSHLCSHMEPFFLHIKKNAIFQSCFCFLHFHKFFGIMTLFFLHSTEKG